MIYFVRNKLVYLILLLGLILRLVSLNQSLWLDEATSILTARDFSFGEILTKFSPSDFHPPLYYLMLRVWVLAFGASEVAARMLSVLFAVATVYVVYLIGKKMFSEKIGLVASLLLATAPLHIYYSQEARMYVPATFFGATAVLFFLKVLKENKFSSWLGLVIFSLLALYTEYVLIFLLVFFAVWLLVFEKEHFRKYARRWVGVAATLIAAFLPWLPTFWQQLQGGLGVKAAAPGWWQVLGGTNLRQLALIPVKFMIGRISSYDKVLYAVSLIPPTLLFGGLFLKSWQSFAKTKFVWLWLMVPIAAAAFSGFWLSIFSYFRFIFVLPAFYLLLAAGALTLAQKWQQLAIVGVLVVNLIAAGIYLGNPRFQREDWRGATRFIEENSKDKQAVTVFASDGQQEAYKYYRKSVPVFGPAILDWGPFGTIWLMRYVQPIFDPQDQVRQKVEDGGFKKVAEHDFNGVVVWQYKK